MVSDYMIDIIKAFCVGLLILVILFIILLIISCPTEFILSILTIVCATILGYIALWIRDIIYK
jgi:hypothetical protein